jgi:hypothetical protein
MLPAGQRCCSTWQQLWQTGWRWLLLLLLLLLGLLLLLLLLGLAGC